MGLILSWRSPVSHWGFNGFARVRRIDGGVQGKMALEERKVSSYAEDLQRHGE
jgi:hypothetical protein